MMAYNRQFQKILLRYPRISSELESVDPGTALKKQVTGTAQQKKLDAKEKAVGNGSGEAVCHSRLSVEQQLYYKEITEACVGSDEGRRSEA